MKKNDAETTTKNTNAKKVEAEKIKKQKKREAAKAKRLKLIEKRKAQAEARKAKRAAKKAKKLAKLEKIKAKKLALREKKRAARQKKLERLAKQKAKAKELKLKAKEKAKLQKQKLEKTEVKQAPDTIDITVKLLKKYVKSLAKEIENIDDKKIKKLEALGFVFDEDAVAFMFSAKRKTKKQVKPVAEDIEDENVTVEATVTVEQPDAIDEAINEVVGDKGDAIEALAKEIEVEDEDNPTEVPIGDTFSDNVSYDQIQANDDQDDEFNDEDDTIDDARDEDDDDKVDFRRDWNSEFGEDGERNEDW